MPRAKRKATSPSGSIISQGKSSKRKCLKPIEEENNEAIHNVVPVIEDVLLSATTQTNELQQSEVANTSPSLVRFHEILRIILLAHHVSQATPTQTSQNPSSYSTYGLCECDFSSLMMTMDKSVVYSILTLLKTIHIGKCGKCNNNEFSYLRYNSKDFVAMDSFQIISMMTRLHYFGRPSVFGRMQNITSILSSQISERIVDYRHRQCAYTSRFLIQISHLNSLTTLDCRNVRITARFIQMLPQSLRNLCCYSIVNKVSSTQVSDIETSTTTTTTTTSTTTPTTLTDEMTKLPPLEILHITTFYMEDDKHIAFRDLPRTLTDLTLDFVGGDRPYPSSNITQLERGGRCDVRDLPSSLTYLQLKYMWKMNNEKNDFDISHMQSLKILIIKHSCLQYTGDWMLFSNKWILPPSMESLLIDYMNSDGTKIITKILSSLSTSKNVKLPLMKTFILAYTYDYDNIGNEEPEQFDEDEMRRRLGKTMDLICKEKKIPSFTSKDIFKNIKLINHYNDYPKSIYVPSPFRHILEV